MAIFGALSELPLPEILTMLGRRSGKLLLWNLPQGKRYEFHVSESRLKGVIIDGRSLTDVLAVRDTIGELIDTDQGSFEFERANTTLQDFDIAIENLLLSAAAAIDEVKAYRDKFPVKRTRFQTVGPVDVWLEDDLYSFWERSAPHLERGSSAEALADILLMNVETIQLKLYKLRSIGKVAPVRAYEAKVKATAHAVRDTVVWSPEEERVSPKATPPSLIGRLLRALNFGRS